MVKAVSEHKPGDLVPVKILRHKKEKIIKVKLGKAKGFYRFKMSGGKLGHLGKFDINIPRLNIHVPHGRLAEGHFDKDHFCWKFKSLRDKLKNVRVHIDTNIKTRLKDKQKKLKKELKKSKKLKKVKVKYI